MITELRAIGRAIAEGQGAAEEPCRAGGNHYWHVMEVRGVVKRDCAYCRELQYARISVEWVNIQPYDEVNK